jgi:hypothetical protein
MLHTFHFQYAVFALCEPAQIYPFLAHDMDTCGSMRTLHMFYENFARPNRYVRTS